MKDTDIQQAKISEIDFMWPYVLPYLEKGLPYLDGKYDLLDIKKLCLDNAMQLWVIYNEADVEVKGIVLTELLTYPQSLRAGIFLVAGDDLDQVMQHLDTIINWARNNNADSIELYGRPGWEKILKKYEFEKTHIAMRLNI